MLGAATGTAKSAERTVGPGSAYCETYGEGVAAGYRSDMKLDTLLDITGANSLSQLLKRQGPRH